MPLVWRLLICYSTLNGTQGLGQRENALSTAKDSESTHGDFFGFLLSALLFSTAFQGWTGKTVVVSEVKTMAYNRAWNSLWSAQMSGN